MAGIRPRGGQVHSQGASASPLSHLGHFTNEKNMREGHNTVADVRRHRSQIKRAVKRARRA